MVDFNKDVLLKTACLKRYYSITIFGYWKNIITVRGIFQKETLGKNVSECKLCCGKKIKHIQSKTSDLILLVQ